MKRMMGCAALLAAVVALAPVQLDAQMGQRGQRGQREMMSRRAQPGVEHIMRMQEQLDLSDSQIGELDAIRELVVQHRTSREAEITELRSQVMSGQLDREAMRESAETRRNASEAFNTDIRSRVESILTDDQKEELGDMMGRARAFQNGRASAQRGQQNFRQGRGAIRGQQNLRQGRAGARGQRGALGHRQSIGQRAWRGERMQAPNQRRMMRRPGGEGPGFGPPWFDLEETPPAPPGG